MNDGCPGPLKIEGKYTFEMWEQCGHVNNISDLKGLKWVMLQAKSLEVRRENFLKEIALKVKLCAFYYLQKID